MGRLGGVELGEMGAVPYYFGFLHSLASSVALGPHSYFASRFERFPAATISRIDSTGCSFTPGKPIR